MFFCSHAVETTVETGPDVATSSNSKVDRPHVSEKISDSKVSTLDSGFKSFRIRRSDSPDVCGRKAYPERKVHGFDSDGDRKQLARTTDYFSRTFPRLSCDVKFQQTFIHQCKFGLLLDPFC